MALFKSEKTKKGEIPPLLNPPLVEAIFEVRWELESDPQTGRLKDPSYPMMYGRLYERLKQEFPIVEDLPSVQVHPEANPFVVRHRIRKEKNGWPLIQVGPGVATLNVAKEYGWQEFQRLSMRLVEAIGELYPKGAKPLNFIKSELRYINAVPFDPKSDSPFTFLQEKLHLKVEAPSDLFSGGEVGTQPLGMGLNLAFPVGRPVGNLLLSINLGEANEKPAYLFQILLHSLGETAPQDQESFEAWTSQAHEVAEMTFISLCKGPLMQRFASLER